MVSTMKVGSIFKLIVNKSKILCCKIRERNSRKLQVIISLKNKLNVNGDRLMTSGAQRFALWLLDENITGSSPGKTNLGVLRSALK